jgi:rubrerythrin
MQATTLGHNRTGATVNPSGLDRMLEAVEDLSPQVPISTTTIEAERLKCIAEADSVGSIPPPASKLKGKMKKAVSAISGISPGLFMDKVGERIAFERTGTRLYDALISKYVALGEVGSAELSALHDVETPLEALRRIRDEEHAHFLMLCEVMTNLGGDPTAQTPCADVAATASMGLMQVVTDPRTTLAQCLDAALIAELTDTASWELLGELATRAGQTDLAQRFATALTQEQKHLVTVRGWLRALTVHAAGTAAV